MCTLVTGVAGFIGSHLRLRPLVDGHDVVAVDKITDYHGLASEKANMMELPTHDRLSFLEANVAFDMVLGQRGDIDNVFHLAAEPGVRKYWSPFSDHLREDVESIYIILETLRDPPDPPRIVLASSCSVYGDDQHHPGSETSSMEPVSPYGVSNLPVERLARDCVRAPNIPAAILQYFTAHRPRQRPGMAFDCFMSAALENAPIELYEDGEQIREYAYVRDVVDSTVHAGREDLPPRNTPNLCGGEPTTVERAIGIFTEFLGRSIRAVHALQSTRDAHRTGGSDAPARRALEWTPAGRPALGRCDRQKWHGTQGQQRRPSAYAIV